MISFKNTLISSITNVFLFTSLALIFTVVLSGFADLGFGSDQSAIQQIAFENSDVLKNRN